VRAYDGLHLRCDTTLAMTTQVLAAYFDLLSHLVVIGGVLCRVRLFLFWVCLCGVVRFSALCTIATSYMTYQCSCFSIRKQDHSI
jgi:hypothetical protein